MSNIELEKKIEELESIIQLQREMMDVQAKTNNLLVDLLAPNIYTVPQSPNTNDICPNGGTHCYNEHFTGGWRCKCGKSVPPLLNLPNS